MAFELVLKHTSFWMPTHLPCSQICCIVSNLGHFLTILSWWTLKMGCLISRIYRPDTGQRVIFGCMVFFDTILLVFVFFAYKNKLQFFGVFVSDIVGNPIFFSRIICFLTRVKFLEWVVDETWGQHWFFNDTQHLEVVGSRESKAPQNILKSFFSNSFLIKNFIMFSMQDENTQL